MTAASPQATVRQFVTDALNRFALDQHRALAWKDSAIYRYPSCVIVLTGENRFAEAHARYAGELGIWQVWLTQKGSRIKRPTPILVDAAPVPLPALEPITDSQQ